MLEGLDRIDWSQLSHAYGPAVDLPDLIRGLADGSSDVRERANADLFSTIWHQGTVYEATPYAVPFLIELASDSTVPGRDHVLGLLYAIAEGWLDRQKYSDPPGKFVPAADVERRELERPHYQSSHTAVARGIEPLSKLLHGDEPEVKAWSAFVLALLTEHAGEVAERLLDAIDHEQEDLCRAVFQFALVSLSQNASSSALTEVAIRRLTSTFEDASSEVSTLGAGIGLLQLRQEQLISRVLEFARPRLVSESHVFETMYWPGCTKLYPLVHRSLRFFPHDQLNWTIEGLHHTDRDVRSTALGLGVHLCEEYRWAPDMLVPVYVSLVERADEDERKSVLQWMRSLGKSGAAALKTLLKHPREDVRTLSTTQLTFIESNRKERESWLAEKHPTPLDSVDSLIQIILCHQGSRKWDDEQKIRDAVIQLGFHGPLAHQAVEIIRPFSERDNPWTRIRAIRALWRITRDADLVVPLLQANLVPGQIVFLLLDCLKQIGPPARSMTNELHQLLDTDRRFFRPYSGDTCGMDEAFCEACSDALQSIEG